MPGMKQIVSIGTLTPFGEIAGVGMISGERYYWCARWNNKARTFCDISMIPAHVIEEMCLPDFSKTEQ